MEENSNSGEAQTESGTGNTVEKSCVDVMMKNDEIGIKSIEHNIAEIKTDLCLPVRSSKKDLDFVIPSIPVHKFAIPIAKVINKSSQQSSLISDVSKIKIKCKQNKTDDTQKSAVDESQKETGVLDDETVKEVSTNMDDKKINFPYTEPSWGGPIETDRAYSLTILKDGIVKGSIDLKGKSLLTFGRMNECDVTIEHPSCSRYHALLQNCVEEKDKRKKGLYLYDMGSTHGTYLNKEKLKPNVYSRVRVGYQMKFGGSSRLYIVEGPEEDQEEEVDLDILREKKRQYQQQMALQKQQKQRQNTDNKAKTSGQLVKENSRENEDKDNDDDGATWGFGEDAKEEGLDLKELFEKKKDIEVKDPKKTLRGFFDREGIEFEYEMSVRGSNNSVIHVAQVRLPIETSEGVEVIAEGTSSNKKEAVLACATDACCLIQAYDMMQSTTREDQRIKRQRELEANDFYDSDDDTFLDRTGAVEKKRLERKKRAGKDETKVEIETHETLKTKLCDAEKELLLLQKKLDLSRAAEQIAADGDSLDSYMSSMKNLLDKTAKMKIKRQVIDLKKEVEKLKKLVEKTKPVELPQLKKERSSATLKKVHQHSNSNNEKPQTYLNTASNPHDQKLVEPRGTNVEPTDNTEQVPEVQNLEEKLEPPVKKQKTKKIYSAPMKPKNTKGKTHQEKDFVEWLPPKGQSGDGRTSLNDKFGY